MPVPAFGAVVMSPGRKVVRDVTRQEAGRTVLPPLEELQELFRALRAGEVDAVVVNSPHGDEIVALQGAEHPYRVMVEAMHEGSLVVTPEGLILYANRRFSQIVDMPLERVVGVHIHHFVQAPDRERLEGLLQRALTGPGTVQVHFTNQLPVMVSANRCPKAPTIAGWDEVVRLCLVTTDLTELDRKEQELRRLNETLEQQVAERTAAAEQRALQLAASEERLLAVNRELEAFCYSVSHDLRGPLRAIGGYAGLLREDAATILSEEGHQRLRMIDKNVSYMGRLIEGLLGFASLGRTDARLARVDMDGLVDEVLGECRAAEPDRVVAVSTHPLPDAVGDRVLLRQVWWNLLSNAFKFTQRRSDAQVEIGWRLAEGSTEAHYYVRDNGVGYNPRFSAKLFKVFERLHSKQDFEGTGVGLAVVQRILEKHGGRVWAEGALDRGATFCFSLPSGMLEAVERGDAPSGGSFGRDGE